MTTITTTGRVTQTFDDAALQASYRAEFTDDGGVAVTLDVFEDGQLVASIPRARFDADEVTGFAERA